MEKRTKSQTPALGQEDQDQTQLAPAIKAMTNSPADLNKNNDLAGRQSAPSAQASPVEMKVFEAMIAQIHSLTERVKKLENGSNYNADHCTCPQEEFKCVDAPAHVAAAAMYLKKAKKKANKDLEATEARKGHIIFALSELLADGGYLAAPHHRGRGNKKRVRKDKKIGEKIKTLTENLTDKIMSLRDPSVKDISEIFVAEKERLAQLGYEDIISQKPKEFEKLIKACSARSPIKTYLRKLTSDSLDMAILNIPKIWREKLNQVTEGSPDSQKQLAVFQELALKANDYCDAFFGEGKLDPEVKNTNDIMKLMSLVKNTLPETPRKYGLLASAVAKLNIMHLVDYIESKIDYNLLNAINDHLTKKLNAHRQIMPDKSMELYCARDGNPDNWIAINDIDIPDPKQKFSIARKFITRDLQFTHDFRLEDIRDLLRFSIILSEQDSESVEKIDRAVEKVLGILMAIFGTDIPENRLRYSFENGSTNGDSTGQHRAFHFTFWYRVQCEALGKTVSGQTQHNMIPVEVQIKPFMSKEKVLDDHKIYEAKKYAKIRKYMGMDVEYPEFIRNLCEAILFCEDYPDKANRNLAHGFERPVKEKWVLTLVSMLNKRTTSGDLANEETIRKIFENPIVLEKVRRVLRIYSKKESEIVQQQARDINEMRQQSREKLMRRFAQFLDNKEQSAQMTSPFSDDAPNNLEKIKSMSNEEIIAAMMARHGGWRLDLYNKMRESEDHPFVETGINILAKRALKILDEYEQKLNQTKS